MANKVASIPFFVLEKESTLRPSQVTEHVFPTKAFKTKLWYLKMFLCLQCHSYEQMIETLQLPLVVPNLLGSAAWVCDPDHLAHQKLLEMVLAK
eukprot:13309478-Ditylum_brightwellii.AAC.1